MVLPGLDQAAGTIMVPLWAAGIAAAAVLIMAILVFGLMLRDSLGAAVGAMAGIGLVLVAATAAYSFSSHFERTEERGALDQRMLELNAAAYASGSYLACLDADLSRSMESWCEKAIFRSPETVATVGAYVKARLSLLSDGLDFARRSEVTYEDRLTDLRRTIEADRFGFVAQIFSREGCTPAKCDALVLLHDAARVRSNLNDSTFDDVLARNKSNWPEHEQPETPVTAARAVPPGWKLPTAASIPAISIMTSEPPAPVQSGAASAPGAQVAPSVRRPAAPPAPRTAQPRLPQTNPANLAPPVQLGPPATNEN